MSKPEPIVVPSDDCDVTVNGETYFPHEGETITLIPGLSAGAVSAINTFMSIGTRIDAVSGEPDEGARVTAIADEALQKLCAALASRVVSWTWTDAAGRPLPQPDGTPEPLLALESSELLWIITAVKGETRSARKNGSRPSPTTSSATAPRPSRTSSGGGPNRRKGF